MGKGLKEFQLCDSRRLRKKPQDAQDDVTEVFDLFDAHFWGWKGIQNLDSQKRSSQYLALHSFTGEIVDEVIAVFFLIEWVRDVFDKHIGAAWTVDQLKGIALGLNAAGRGCFKEGPIDIFGIEKLPARGQFAGDDAICLHDQELPWVSRNIRPEISLQTIWC